MIYFAFFDLPQKDKDVMLKSLENDNHRQILRNMEYLDANLVESKKFRRTKEEMTTDEFNEFMKN